MLKLLYKVLWALVKASDNIYSKRVAVNMDQHAKLQNICMLVCLATLAKAHLTISVYSCNNRVTVGVSQAQDICLRAL